MKRNFLFHVLLLSGLIAISITGFTGCFYENKKDASHVSETELEQLADDADAVVKAYFKEKYELDDYQKFYFNLKRNSLYFLENNKKSYNKYVRSLIESVFVNESESRDVMTLYRISKDMSHASGYNFNASEGIIDSYFHKTLIYTWKLLKYFLLNASLTMEEHDEECNVTNVINMIDSFIKIEEQALDDAYKSYENV